MKKFDCCKKCIVNAVCPKDFSYNSTICQDAKNELGYHLYRNHPKTNTLYKYRYIEFKDVFNQETLTYIKAKLKRCRPKKQFRSSTINLIEKKIKKLLQHEYEDLMSQIYGSEDPYMWTGDAPGYRG